MKVVVASDHAGYELKEAVKKHLIDEGHEVIDVGTNSTESCDYPVFAKALGATIVSGQAELGVLCCGTGEGIMMAANKVPGIRAGIGYADEVVALTRQHNDANVVSFGARFMSQEDVLRRVDIFLNTKFEGGRHEKRKNMIENL